MSNKFSVGDKVLINKHSKRLPTWIKTGIRRFYRIRIIGAIFYYPSNQHTAYYLGTNNKEIDISRYPFRAEMLKLYKMKPHTKHLKINKARLVIGEYSEQPRVA